MHFNPETVEPEAGRTVFLIQEKARLVTDLKRLKKHFKAYEPTLKELDRKYKVIRAGGGT